MLAGQTKLGGKDKSFLFFLSLAIVA